MTSRCLFAVVAGAVLAFSAVLRADFLVDDLEHAGKANYIGGEWGFADDHYNGGVSKILNGDSLQFGTQPADYRWVFRGSYGEGVEGGSSNAAVMQYRLGSVKPPAGGNANVALSCGFILYGEKALSLRGSSGLSFYIKADQATKVEVNLSQNFGKTGWYPSFTKQVSASTAWQKVSILWSEMALPSWAATPQPVLLNFIDSCRGLSFVVDAGSNTNPAFQLTGKILVDSVVIVGMPANPIDKQGYCPSCVGAASTADPAGFLVTNFDAADALMVTVVSDVVKTNGVPNQAGDPTATPTQIESSPVTVSTGFNGTGGAQITYKLGPAIAKDGYTQTPLAGIVIPLKTTTWDQCLSTVGATGIFLRYKTSFGSGSQIQIYARNSTIYKGYAFPYVNLPGTNGEWKTATLPWSKFALPSWSDLITPVFEVLSEIGVIYVGNENDQGSVAIDNVIVMGLGNGVLTPYSESQMDVINGSLRTVGAGVTASVKTCAGALSVRYALPTGSAGARVDLLDFQGKVVGSGMASALSGEIRLQGVRPSHGAYVLRIRLDRAGRKSSVTHLTVTL